MSVEFYMNKSTGEITEDYDEAVEWYRDGDDIGLYTNHAERTCWVHEKMKDDIRSNSIWFVECTFQGAWVIHGEIGQRQYMGYTQAQAKRMYKEECKTNGNIVCRK